MALQSGYTQARLLPTVQRTYNLKIVNEITPKRFSGAFGSCHQLFLTFAIVITYLIGMLLPSSDADADMVRSSSGWRVAMAMPGILAAIQVLLLIFVYKLDSPTYYCETGQKALVSLGNQGLDERIIGKDIC